ncbi:MAG: beta-galactosidase trimerization domain-containing protein, partial [Planctomycetes bacterium]|nr:beta-galactosidase trimerization domain-containing protein [Planctomycetota bacterium]
INWMHQYISLGRQWIQRFSWHEYKEDERSVLRSSWIKLIEDIGLQFLFVTPQQLSEGRLAAENIRVLILPEVWSLSDEEVAHIENFVANGGTLIADQFTGLYDAHGKRRSQGALDQLMGIDQSWVLGDERYANNLVIKKSVPAVSVDFDTRQRLRKLPVRVNAADAKIALGDAKNAALITRSYGKGQWVFLNIDLSHYSRVRMFQKTEKQREAIIQTVSSYLPQSVKAFATVLNAQGERQQGIETALWHVGENRKVLSFIRNPQACKEGLGGESFVDNALFEQEETMTVVLPQEYEIINQRTGEYLGREKQFTFTHHAFSASLFSLSTEKVQLPLIEVSKEVQRGDHVSISVTDADTRVDYLRVYFMELINPQGDAVWYYQKDVSARTHQQSHSIPIALNDVVGTWTVRVTDVFSRQQLETKVLIKD